MISGRSSTLSRPSTARHADRARPCVTVQSTRRQLLAAVGGVSLIWSKIAEAAEPASANEAQAKQPEGGFISIMPINNDAKSYLDMRDDAMEFQCKGGMFDCDGDRRDFAKKQYQDWLDAGGVPKRIREGQADGPRAY